MVYSADFAAIPAGIGGDTRRSTPVSPTDRVFTPETASVRARHGSKALIALLLLTMFACRAASDVRPSSLFTEGAILQRGMRAPIWGTASDGERVTVTLLHRRAVTIAKRGHWMVTLPPMEAGGPYTLTVSGLNSGVSVHVWIGDVYLCSGEGNMEWPLTLCANAMEAVPEARDPLLHLYTVPKGAAETPLAEAPGDWQACTPDSARGFSAVAYFFGRSLRSQLKLPVGLIQGTYSGTPVGAWIGQSARALAAGSPSGPANQLTPSALYNAMIAPLVPYAIRGVILYEGESSVGTAYAYQSLFSAMIASWRTAWNRADLPFLFIQLAPFMKREDFPRESAWAELREAQRLTSRSVPNTAMAVITDLGDESDIHPRDKQPVGERLALLARRLIYKEDVEANGPAYNSMQVDGDKIVLRFQDVGGGLESRGGSVLSGFTVAGDDQKFVNASALIRGDTVVVSASGISHPVAVRYGWADYPMGSLWSKAGWPASPFRTDSFPLTTQPVPPAEAGP